MNVAEEILRQEIRDVLESVDLSRAVYLAELRQRISLNEREVSALTGIPVKTLQNDRNEKVGIKFCKKGTSVYYRNSDVQEFMSMNIIRTRDHE